MVRHINSLCTEKDTLVCRYLEVRCIATRLGGRTEASGPKRQVSDCLLGEGALDDVGVIAVLLCAGSR